MLKCAGNDDAITMKADDAGDVVTFMFESPGEYDYATRRGGDFKRAARERASEATNRECTTTSMRARNRSR